VNLHAVQPGESAFSSCTRAFESEFDYVYRTLRRLGVRGNETEDQAQEVFLVLWRRWGQYDRARSLRSWLAGIAVKVALRHHRNHRRREIPRDDLHPADPLPGPEDQLASSRARDLVLRGLASLSEKYRTVLVLHELDERPVREIAADLGVPLFTVHTRLRRARIMFAQWLAAENAPLAPGELMAIERRPLPAPAAARERAGARLRAMAAHPPLPAPPVPAAPWRWIGAGAGAVAVAAVVVAVGRPRPHKGHPHVARAAVAPPAATTPPLDRGLVGRWSFDEARGGKVPDLSGRGNDCVLRELDPASAFVDGVHGRAIDLGTKGWLECPQPAARAGVPVELSVSAWVKRARTRAGSVIATRYLGPAEENFFHFAFARDSLRVWSGTWRGWTTKELRGLEDGWIHVAFTHAGPRTRLFVNGTLVAHHEDQPVRGGGTATRPLLIGGSIHRGEIWQHLDGAVDEVRIYDRALSDDEIEILAREPGP
jgi:RNA polymerase sigma-70 factor (ECF subfamily)